MNATIEEQQEQAYKALGTASYSPDDNKIRVTPFNRLDAETYARVKAAGYVWAPRQKIFVAPMWTPGREDIALELCGEIGDEDTSLVERAEERAERFEDYSASRAEDANRAHKAVAAIADNIPLGQPIMVGHHSEKRARRDAERIRAGMAKAVSMWETSKYWIGRAKGAVRAAKYKELPGVRHRRIKGLEADKRKQVKRIDEAEHYSRLWGALPTNLDEAHTRALKIANYDHIYLPQDPAKPYRGTVWGALDKFEISVDDAARLALEQHERTILDARRWIAHIDNRLAYERAMLGESGGVVTDHYDIVVGGKVLITHWRTRDNKFWTPVLRVNRANDAIQSVSTSFGVMPIEGVFGYEAPAPGAEPVKSRLAPMINAPSPGCREMTKAEWARTHKDYKGGRTAKATAEHAAYRCRVIMHEGSMVAVFLKDAKRVDPPAGAPAAPQLPRFRNGDDVEGDNEGAPVIADIAVPAPRRVELEVHTTAEGAAKLQSLSPEGVTRLQNLMGVTGLEIHATEPNVFEAMKASLKAGVQVVSADQLFPTPEALADRIVKMVEIGPGHRVLEPSAGTGSLVRAIKNEAPTALITAVEINRRLAELNGWREADFLELKPADLGALYDRVVMNPPFSNGADVEHVTHAFGFLRPRGRLVAIMAMGVSFREDSKTKAFRALVERSNGEIIKLPDHAFAAQGTGVRVVLVTMEAP